MKNHAIYTTIWTPTPINRGSGVDIAYGWYKSMFGEILIAATPRGICFTGFKINNAKGPGEDRLRHSFPAATFIRDDKIAASYGKKIDAMWTAGGAGADTLPLDLYGTDFQIKVWRALLKIPFGQCLTYGDIAVQIGKPTAARAVGGAVGSNPVSILVPCHRVLASTRILGNYGWGPAVKKTLLAHEGVAL